MALIIHNISSPDDGLGDQLREAFDYQNEMNTELYADKVDKETGKGLSTNDFTDVLKDKLDNIEEFAEVNVQVDWFQNDIAADDYIKNKPAISEASDWNDEFIYSVSNEFTIPAGLASIDVLVNQVRTLNFTRVGNTITILDVLVPGDVVWISGVVISILTLNGKENILTAGANIVIDRTNPFNPVISASITGGGVNEFTELTDTPATYSGQGGKGVKVKADETGLEFGTVGDVPTLPQVLARGNRTLILDRDDTPTFILEDRGNTIYAIYEENWIVPQIEYNVGDQLMIFNSIGIDINILRDANVNLVSAGGSSDQILKGSDTAIITFIGKFGPNYNYTYQVLQGSPSAGTPIDSTTLGTAINGFTAETPVDADTIPFSDASDTNKAKKVSFANLKSFFKTYFDTLYATASTIASALATFKATENLDFTSSGQTQLNGKQATLIQGTNITISGTTISSSQPNATSSVKGIAKIYTELGTNTDGSIDQKTITDELVKHRKYLYKDFTTVTHTGNTSNTIVKSIEFKQNELKDNSSLSFINTMFTKTGTAGIVTYRLYVNTINSITGATQINRFQAVATSAFFAPNIDFFIKGSQLYGQDFTIIYSNNQANSGSFAISSMSLDLTNKIYFIVTVTLGNSADSVSLLEINISN